MLNTGNADHARMIRRVVQTSALLFDRALYACAPRLYWRYAYWRMDRTMRKLTHNLETRGVEGEKLWAKIKPAE